MEIPEVIDTIPNRVGPLRPDYCLNLYYTLRIPLTTTDFSVHSLHNNNDDDSNNPFSCTL